MCRDNFKNYIVQQGMNHDKPYFSNMSGHGINMLIFMANYYSFL